MKALLIPLLFTGCATCVPPLTCQAPIQQSHSVTVAEAPKAVAKPPVPKSEPKPKTCEPRKTH
jgi:hypothetical protein